MKLKSAIMVAAISAALALSGCQGQSRQANNDSWDSDEGAAICVDQNGYRVDDDFCDDGRMGYMPMFFYSGSHVPKYGSKYDNRYATSKPSAGRYYASKIKRVAKSYSSKPSSSSYRSTSSSRPSSYRSTSSSSSYRSSSRR